MALEPGNILGPYEVIAPLGAGGMGEVYRARDTRLGREAAIKALPDAFARDGERLARFEREAKMLASLSHPNIAGVYGLEVVEGHRYLAMEFVEGETLAARLERGPLPVDEAVQVCAQIAAAIESAHEAGVVHRDLKPGNVMVRPDCAVKVLDFGLAKAAGPEGGGSSEPALSMSPTISRMATEAGVILGTVAYMSPEQARGKPVDRRTDIWSFGCVLYECLTARRVHDGETVSDVLARILEREPDWSALPAATPPHVRRLLERCLTRDSRLRLRDVGEARIALTTPGAVTEAAPSTAEVARRRVPRALLVAIALLAGFVGAGATWLLKPAGTGAESPVRKLDLVSPDVDTNWFLAPLLSPAGDKIAYSSAGRIWVRSLDRLNAVAVADAPEIPPILWSPDGTHLAYASRGKLWKVQVEGGTPIAIADIPGSKSLVGGDWSVDGNIVIAVWRGGLYRVSAATRSPVLLLDTDANLLVDYHFPKYLPDGSILYMTHWKTPNDEAGRVRPVLSILRDGESRPVTGFEFGYDRWMTIWGDHLIFIRSEPNAGIWAIRFDPGSAACIGQPFLIASNANSISLASDGSLLYVESVVSDQTRELGWVDRSGKWLGRLGSARPDLSSPVLSPDARRVALIAGVGEEKEIWIYDTVRGTETRLTFEPGHHHRPVWLDAQRILYATYTDMSNVIALRNADGSGAPRVLTRHGGQGTGDAVLEASGEADGFLHIVDAAGRGELRRFHFDGQGVVGEPEQVVRGNPEPNVSDMQLSPDGKLLAFVAEDAGVPEIYLTRYPSGDGTWQVSSAGGRLPRWDADSGTLYYISGSGPARRSLSAVETDPDEAVPVGTQWDLFPLDGMDVRYAGFDWGFAVEPGGQRFLVARPVRDADAPAPRMILTQNWWREFEALRQ